MNRKGTGLNWRDGTLGPNDLDWRETEATIQDALEEAFQRTGYSRDQFTITRWGRDANGKSFPVEWRGPDGAEVNVDWAHGVDNAGNVVGFDRSGRWGTGPDAPHVGWQVGKNGKKVGHILLDDVPYNR